MFLISVFSLDLRCWRQFPAGNPGDAGSPEKPCGWRAFRGKKENLKFFEKIWKKLLTDSESSGNICFVERHMRAARQEMQEWRNWQTRRLQVPVVARSCGFKSHLLHYFLPCLEWCRNFPAGSFYFCAEKMCRRGKKNRRISDSVKLFKIIAIIHIFHKIQKIKIFSKKVLTFL